VHLAVVEQQPPSELYLGDELIDDHRKELRKMLFGDFPELLQHLDSPPVGRPWDQPMDTTGPMRRQRLSRLSHAKRWSKNDR
jgi:hypothetical protein